tara:strand:- start:112 stop:636 length:525 start_codon:yes stop_codon:yes gene_type:complete
MRNIRIDITDKEVVENICDIATKVCGLRKGILSSPTRLQKIHLPRMVASNICLIEKGIHYNTIAEVINRDRSSIYHYERYHEVYYSNWDIYRRLFNKVYNAYTEGKKAQLKDIDLKDILNNAGIYNRKDYKVFIDVVVGEASVRLRSTYKHFTEDVENIKRALKDYVHDLYINL